MLIFDNKFQRINYYIKLTTLIIKHLHRQASIAAPTRVHYTIPITPQIMYFPESNELTAIINLLIIY